MQCADQVGSRPCAQRLREHLLAQLVCPGRHTITSLLTTNGKQFQDWSSDYYLYAKERIDLQSLKPLFLPGHRLADASGDLRCAYRDHIAQSLKLQSFRPVGQPLLHCIPYTLQNASTYRVP